MIMRRFFTKKTGIHLNYIHNKCAVFSYPPLSRSCSTFFYGCHRNIATSLTFPQCLQLGVNRIFTNFVWNQKYYTNGRGLLDGDVTELLNKVQENELNLISQLFPNPRVSLNELCTKIPEKVFDIYYKQNVSVSKGGKKKKIPKVSDWTCTYAFVWPEKMKFESTSISKKQAAEKAATQALHWLYHNKRIDKHGLPLYDRDKIDEIKSTLNEPLTATISENSVERVQRIWEEYEGGIRDVFDKTHEEAIRKTISTPLVITKDSTIDEEDEYSEVETCEESGDEATSELKTQIHPVYGKPLVRPSQLALERRRLVLQKSFEHYDSELTPLPIDDYAENITETIQNNRVTVIVGAAGCGKSTRAPAAILKSCGVATKALVSEPRKVAAIGLAQRVSSELGEEVGETVGFQVRLKAKPPRPPGGSILYCTSGVLLRRLQLNPGLEGCTHVFIDEAHERDVNTDITLLLLKRALDFNPELRVVVMSATLDTEVFARYFDSCPIVEVPGRTFPVKVTHLEKLQEELGSLDVRQTLEASFREDSKPFVYSEEVVNIIKAVDRSQPEGAILVFLPGWAEIKAINNLLHDTFCNSSTHLILPVHSRLSTEDQTKMFARPLPGVRKIVLSTNIAETSITIPDVVYVIDSGAHKENRIKEGTGTATLETVWVSQAAAKQRTGRAGRVQPGHCYRLYTKEKELEFATHTTPEILRIPLVQTVLDCKTYAPEDKVASFLSQLPEPPSHKAIDIAVKDLVDLGALSSTEQVTPLGRYLSTFTLHPRLSTCLIHAAIIGNVVSTANIATHLSDNVEIFRQSIDRRQEIREIKVKYSPTSDHTALHWIQDEFEQTLNSHGWSGVDTWCEKYGLRKDRLNYVKALSNVHLEQLLKCGIVDTRSDPDQLIRFSDIDELTVATLLSGSNCLLVSKRHLKTKGKMMMVKEVFTSSGDRAHIGSDSVNSGLTKQRPGPKPDLLIYFGGYHSTERRALVLYKTSLVNTLTALLFCKGTIRRKELMNSSEETSVLKLPKHRLEVHVPATQADLILKVREMIWNTFQYYYERDTRHIETEIDTEITRFRTRLVKTIGRILVEAENDKSDSVEHEDFR